MTISFGSSTGERLAELVKCGAVKFGELIGNIYENPYLIKFGEVLKPKEEKTLCNCGHWIEIVGTKWQHMDKLNDGDSTDPNIEKCMGFGSVKKYREACYHCACIEPAPRNTGEKP